jgi:hypothetical protein
MICCFVVLYLQITVRNEAILSCIVCVLRVIESGLKPQKATLLVSADGGCEISSSELSRAHAPAIKSAADEWIRAEGRLEFESVLNETRPVEVETVAVGPLAIPAALANGERALAWRKFTNCDGNPSHFQSKVAQEIEKQRRKRPLNPVAAAPPAADSSTPPASPKGKKSKNSGPLRTCKTAGQMNITRGMKRLRRKSSASVTTRHLPRQLVKSLACKVARRLHSPPQI